MVSDRIWISWDKQRRNVGMAAASGARLYMSDINLPRWHCIFTEFLKIWKLIQRDKPLVCSTMNPMIFTSWRLSFHAKVYRFILVTDHHSLNIKITNKKKYYFVCS